MTKYNIWFFGSLMVALIVAMPIITVFFSFFTETSDYFYLLKDTFLFEYIFNSITILFFVIFFTFILGIFSAYFVSFYEFPLSNFFSWAVILSFAIPGYIYAFSIIAFFENYGTAFSLLTFLFGENNYNPIIPKIDGLIGAIISISFSLFPYVYVLTRASFYYQSNNYIEVGKNLGLSSNETFFYNVITFLIILINLIIIYLIYVENGAKTYFLIIILGGSFGNLFDRLYYRAVPDFIDLNYNGYHWFIFNVADIFITLGIFCLILAEIIYYKKDQ